MRILSGLGAALLCVLLWGCSAVPSLEATATGPMSSEPPKLFIKDVLARVKCELFQAAKSLRGPNNQPNNRLDWMRDWSAKSNLSLSLVESAGLSPNFSYSNPLQNAYYVATTTVEAAYLASKPGTPVKPSSLGPSSWTSTVAQKFTLGANLNLSENATRTETIVFTGAFGDVVTNKNIAPMAKSLAVTDCDKLGDELRGNLGLTEWINSALTQVESGQLLSFRRTGDNPLWQDSFGSLHSNVCALSDNVYKDNYPYIGHKRSSFFDNYCTPREKLPNGYPTFVARAIEVRAQAFAFNDDCIDEAAKYVMEKYKLELKHEKIRFNTPETNKKDIDSITDIEWGADDSRKDKSINQHQSERIGQIRDSDSDNVENIKCRLTVDNLASRISPSAENTFIGKTAGSSGAGGGGAKSGGGASKPDPEATMQTYKTGVVKSIEEAKLQYKQTIKAYVDVLESKEDRDNINGTMKELDGLEKLLKSDDWDLQQYATLLLLAQEIQDLGSQGGKAQAVTGSGTPVNPPVKKAASSTSKAKCTTIGDVRFSGEAYKKSVEYVLDHSCRPWQIYNKMPQNPKCVNWEKNLKTKRFNSNYHRYQADFENFNVEFASLNGPELKILYEALQGLTDDEQDELYPQPPKLPVKTGTGLKDDEVKDLTSPVIQKFIKDRPEESEKLYKELRGLGDQEFRRLNESELKAIPQEIQELLLTKFQGLTNTAFQKLWTLGDKDFKRYEEYKEYTDNEAVAASCVLLYIGAIHARSLIASYDWMQNYTNQLDVFINSGVKPAKPVDSLTHTVTFVIAYSGGISPNWTLLNFTSANNPLASASGLKTHTLLITIGPDSENTANFATQQVVNTLSAH